MRIDDRTQPPSLAAMPECAPQPAMPAQVWLDKQIRASLARATGGLSVISASLAGLDWALQLGIAPAKVVQAWQVWLQHSIEDSPRLLPTTAEPPSVDVSDQRFADAGWQDGPYRCWRDAFMRNEAFWESLTQDIDGLSRHHQHIVAFCARQWLDLFAPGNVWWMNPTVASAASSTFGANFLQGAHHWLQDASELLSELPGLPAGRPALEYLPGRDVALTPGKVVFRNANRDTTRLPYRLHSECLHKLFLGNELATGKLCVGGRPIALSDLDLPLFVAGTEHDHGSPWRSVYKLHLLTQAELTFLLTSGGHNAGIVSEPGHPRRRYHVYTRLAAAPYLSPEQFLDMAEYREGSWWPAWHDWLVAHSTERCTRQAPARDLADAPGAYVLEP